VKTVGVLLGIALFGGLIVLAVAGVTGATAILVTAVAIVGMIALGNLLGGRTTPNRAPYGTGDPDAPRPTTDAAPPAARPAESAEVEGRPGTTGP